MTCIAGLVSGGGVWLAGDSSASGGLDQYILGVPKVFRKGPMVIGGAGSIRIIQVLQYDLKLPDVRRADTARYMCSTFPKALIALVSGHHAMGEDSECGKKMDAALLIGWRGQLFVIQDDFSVFPAGSAPFLAVGSGWAAAQAALHQQELLGDTRDPEKRLIDALTISSQYTTNVAPPFYVVST